MWSFSDIESSEPSRASALEMAPSAEEIRALFLRKFGDAARVGTLQIGMEQCALNSDHRRVVLQFHVGKELSDFFFNARTGYRAQFRSGWRVGLDYNGWLIDGIRSEIASFASSSFSARNLTPDFEDCGDCTVSRDDILNSLDTHLSKVWLCAKLLSNGLVTLLPIGLVGPRLLLAPQGNWAGISRDDHQAWLEVKGAFVGVSGCYQPKDPIERAKRLSVTGEA